MWMYAIDRSFSFKHEIFNVLGIMAELTTGQALFGRMIWWWLISVRNRISSRYIWYWSNLSYSKMPWTFTTKIYGSNENKSEILERQSEIKIDFFCYYSIIPMCILVFLSESFRNIRTTIWTFVSTGCDAVIQGNIVTDSDGSSEVLLD